VIAGGRASTWWANGAGVKQGDLCSPVLYSVFINDVVTALHARNVGVRVSDRLPLLSVLLYADDQVLLADSPEQLQTMMDLVEEYATRWRFRLNCKKSAVMVYGSSPGAHPPRLWWFGGDLVAERTSYRYLGVILQADGGFTLHGLDLLQRGRRRLGMLRHRFLRGGRLPGSLGRVLIMAHMFGVLEYGAAVWSCQLPACAPQIDALWRLACRATLGAPRFLHSAAALGDLELLPLHIRRAMLIATLYHKVAAAPVGSIVSEVFHARRRQFLGMPHHPLLHFTWLQQVDEALRLLGLSEHFLHLEDEDLEGGLLKGAIWKTKVLLGARAAMAQWWRAELARHGPSMDLLSLICPDGPARARYIEARGGRQKSFLASLRAGSLPLRQCAPACRFARFDALAVDELCRLCGTEDESLLHFIFRCPVLGALRRLADPFWASFSPDLLGIAKVLSGFSGSAHGFQRVTRCWFRMWCFRNDCLRLDPVSFQLRWPGAVQPLAAAAAAAVVAAAAGAPPAVVVGAVAAAPG
jgi:Reverse transcriptase (RNA-dependent DNA polymerase)